MKALSIKQPWASLIAHGIKDIENRTWKTKFRGRIYIHASGKSDKEPYKIFTDEQASIFIDSDLDFKMLESYKQNSQIIGEVDIIDCVINHPSIWAEQSLTRPDVIDDKYYNNPFLDNCSFNQKLYNKDLSAFDNSKPIYNWVLANAKLYDKPILNVKGKLSLWETNYIHCENCNKPHHCNEMVSNEEAHWFCNSCLEEAKV